MSEQAGMLRLDAEGVQNPTELLQTHPSVRSTRERTVEGWVYDLLRGDG